jgi:HJR/Mrr/RecB family endonuclease
MSYSRHSGSEGLVAGFFWLCIPVWIVSGIFKIGIWLSAGIVFAAYGLIVLTAYLVHEALQWAALQKPCIHGVKRGKEGGCTACALDELKRDLESKLRRAEEQRKKELREKAAAMHSSELTSLRKKWLSRSELYLQMSPRQFENAIAQVFRELGYEVKQTPYSNDGGKDAVVWKDGEKYLVECKRYEANNKIGRRDLQIFVAAMKEENAKAGYYVNTGRFASTAAAYAKENQIELYDRHRLPALINSAYPTREEIATASVMCLECGTVEHLPVDESPSASVCVNGHAVTNEITTRLVCSGAFAPSSFCERCGSDLRLVNGRYRKFWVCSKYPRCRFTRRYRGA